MSTCKDCVHYTGCTSDWHKLINIEHICNNFKTNADYVEVVRCKDCLYATERYGHLNCINGVSYRNSWNKPDDYCSYGERKTE